MKSRTISSLLCLLVAVAAPAIAQSVPEPVTVHFGDEIHPATLVRGSSGDTLYVNDSLALDAVLSRRYDILGARRRGSAWKEGGGYGMVFGFLAGTIWHISEGGTLGSVVNLFVDEEEDPVLYTLTEQKEGPWRWRIAVGTFLGGLLGVGLGALMPDNPRIRLDRDGLTVMLASPTDGSIVVPPEDP